MPAIAIYPEMIMYTFNSTDKYITLCYLVDSMLWLLYHRINSICFVFWGNIVLPHTRVKYLEYIIVAAEMMLLRSNIGTPCEYPLSTVSSSLGTHWATRNNEDPFSNNQPSYLATHIVIKGGKLRLHRNLLLNIRINRPVIWLIAPIT